METVIEAKNPNLDPAVPPNPDMNQEQFTDSGSANNTGYKKVGKAAEPRGAYASETKDVATDDFIDMIHKSAANTGNSASDDKDTGAATSGHGDSSGGPSKTPIAKSTTNFNGGSNSKTLDNGNDSKGPLKDGTDGPQVRKSAKHAGDCKGGNCTGTCMNDMNTPVHKSDDTNLDEESAKNSNQTILEEEISFTEDVIITEATDSNHEGHTWDVVIIKSGTSKNFNHYPTHVIKAAADAGLFEGVRAFADHPSKTEAANRPERSIRDIVGWFSDTHYVAESQEVRGKFHVLDSADWLRKGMLSAYNQGKPDLYGFSIRADARAVTEKSAGRLVRNVESLLRVPSVDVVTDPSAGGRVVRILASNIIDPELEEESVVEENEKKTDKAAVTALEEVTAARNETAALLQETRRERFAAVLDRKLAESKLPEKAITRLRDHFTAIGGTETSISEGIVTEREYLADVAGFGVKDHGTSRVVVGNNERDKMGDAFYGMLEQKDVNGVPHFHGLREAYCKIKGIADWDIRPDVWLKETWAGSQHFGDDGSTQLQEALTSTSWATIFGDSVTRKLLKEYQLPAYDEWRKVVSEVSSAKDFRTMRRERVGGYNLLPTVAQAGAYAAQTSPGPDQEATLAVTKRGGTEILTLEALVNDDLGAIRRIPTKLGRAAAMTLYHFVFDFLKDNTTNVTFQAQTLYGFGNKSSNGLDSAGLTSAKIRMASQAGFDYPNTGAFDANNNPLGGQTFQDALLTRPKYLIVPIHLAPVAQVLLQSDKLPGTLDNDINIHKGTLEPITVQYWTAATAAPGSGVGSNTVNNSWFLLADPSLIPTMEISFLGGKEEPELFTQDMQNVGVMFDSDQIKYKIRHIYGGGLLDWRGFDASYA